MRRSTLSERGLVLAPLGRDAAIASQLLGAGGIESEVCPSLPELIAALDRGAAFVVVTEEAIRGADLSPLTHWLETQETWSDVPFIVLTQHGGGPERNPAALRIIDTLGNVTFLERPFHPTTFASIAKAALRGRSRQYETRRLIAALSESEDQYRHAVELNPQVAWTAGPDGQLDHVARRWTDWTGLSGLGEAWVEGIHEPDRAPSIAAWAHSVGSGEPYDIEHRVRMRDGSLRWAHSRAYPRRDAQGRIIKWYGTTEDIEDRKSAEAARAASEARYETLFRSMDEGFCVIEFLDGPHGPMSDYVHVSANSAYERHAGIANVVGQKVREMVPDEAEGWVELYRSVLVTGNPIRFERELVATGRHLELASFRVEPPSLRQVAVVFKDVTARRQAEIALRDLNETLEARVAERTAERNLLATMVETTDALIQALDLDYRFVAINRACVDAYQRVFGVAPRIGDSLLELLADRPDSQAAAEAVWSRALAGENFSFTGPFGHADRERRTYELHFETLTDPQGRRVGAFLTGRDVSDQKAKDEALAKAQAQLFETQKMETIGQLTGGVAHDFNNLLSAILSNLDLVQRRIEDPRALKLVEGAIKGAERGAALTKRLLAFARRQDLKTEAVSLPALMDGMRELLERSLGPSVALEVARPPGDAATMASVDPNQLELALLNLAVNARDAMPDGGVLRIALRTETVRAGGGVSALKPGDYAVLRVSDTGEGMDPATLARATEPFFTTKGVGKGTGLGLSMVDGLARQSGGAMRLDSRQGEGTSVEIWLPQAAPAVAPAETAVPREAAPLDQLTVLVVDDDMLVGMGTSAMIEDLGHRVLEAASGPAALAIAAEHPEIDLVVTDHAMPGMTGAALAQELRRSRPALPVVLASGYAELPNGEGADLPRLPKPFRQDELAAALAAAMERGRAAAAGALTRS